MSLENIKKLHKIGLFYFYVCYYQTKVYIKKKLKKTGSVVHYSWEAELIINIKTSFSQINKNIHEKNGGMKFAGSACENKDDVRLSILTFNSTLFPVFVTLIMTIKNGHPMIIAK